jgi:uncharacterized membrane protein (DUF373 family)
MATRTAPQGDPTVQEAEARTAPRSDGSPRRRPAFRLRGPVASLELAQDAVTVLVGVALIALAVALLVSAVRGLFASQAPMTLRAAGFLDQVLLVLILVEIVHTVMLSLRSHELQAEPFIVVGLIAAIRKLLFVLGSEQHLSTTEYALFLATAVVFLAAYVAVRRWAPASGSGRSET